MKILVTGASGLVGGALVAEARRRRSSVACLVRSPKTARQTENAYYWNPATKEIDREAFRDCDAVVHLAGENIAAGRWNNARKKRIRDSRIFGTRLIRETLADLCKPPSILISASAIGYYGSRGDETLNESAAPGIGFLPEVCQAWEAEALAAAKHDIRVVCLRTGVVLSPRGGALAKMLTPFKLGVGGVLGDGGQWMSWVDLDDIVGIIFEAIENESLSGPVNAVAPNPVTNRTFTQTLGKVLRRPTILPMPAVIAHAVFGEMADALLLASTRVIAKSLETTRYPFAHRDLEASLRQQLRH